MNYRITVARTSTRIKDLDLEASNFHEATLKALEDIANIDFSDSGDYDPHHEIIDVREI